VLAAAAKAAATYLDLELFVCKTYAFEEIYDSRVEKQ